MFKSQNLRVANSAKNIQKKPIWKSHYLIRILAGNPNPSNPRMFTSEDFDYGQKSREKADFDVEMSSSNWSCKMLSYGQKCLFFLQISSALAKICGKE